MSYDKDYVEFDEFGLKEVRCMCCNTLVAKRSYVEVDSKIEPNKKEKVLTFKRLPNWRQVKVNLSDGSYAEPIFCIECVDGDIDCDRLTEQIKKGWDIDMKACNKSNEDIEKFKKITSKLKVLPDK